MSSKMLSVSRSQHANELAIVKSKSSSKIKSNRQALEMQHEEEIIELKNEIQHLSTQVVSFELVVEECKAKLQKLGQNVDTVVLTDTDYTSLENIVTLRKEITRVKGENALLKSQLKETTTLKTRAQAQTKSSKSTMVQQLHWHKLQCEKYEAEINMLQTKNAKLEHSILNGSSTSGVDLKKQIVAQIRTDMAAQALEESKRVADREKKLMDFYQDKYEVDTAVSEKEHRRQLSEATTLWTKRMQASQLKHQQELQTQTEIWESKVHMVRRAAETVENPQLSDALANTQIKLLETVAKLHGNNNNTLKLPEI